MSTDNKLFIPEDYAKQADKTILRTNMYPGDNHLSNYDADAVAWNARNNIETTLTDMVHNRDIRGGRKRRERIKQRYRDALEERLSNIESGNTSYINGKLNYEGSDFDDNIYGNTMNNYLRDVINQTGSHENRVDPSFGRYMAAMYGHNPDMDMESLFKIFRSQKVQDKAPRKIKKKDPKTGKEVETDEYEKDAYGNIIMYPRYTNNDPSKPILRDMNDSDIWNEYVKPAVEQYDKFMSNLTLEEYQDRFLAGLRHRLSTPEKWASFSTSHPMRGVSLPTPEDHMSLNVRGMVWPSLASTPAATTYANRIYKPGDDVTVRYTPGTATGTPGAGNAQKKPEEYKEPAVNPDDLYILAHSLNPNFVTIDYDRSKYDAFANDDSDPLSVYKDLGYTFTTDDNGNIVPGGNVAYNRKVFNNVNDLIKMRWLINDIVNGQSTNPIGERITLDKLTNYIGDANDGSRLFLINTGNGPTKPSAHRIYAFHPNGSIYMPDQKTMDTLYPSDSKLLDMMTKTNHSPAWFLGNQPWIDERKLKGVEYGGIYKNN